jgi:hypothetical protein
MLKAIGSGVLLTVGLTLSPMAIAQGAPVNCDAGMSQCGDVCDGEKTWGFIRGKKYKDCAARCEEQVTRQCKSKSQGSGVAAPADHHGDKVHPQGKEYGYEKNADKIKGQQGAAMSAGRGKGEGKHEDGIHPDKYEGHEMSEHDLEEEAEEMKEKAEKIKKEKAMGKGKAKVQEKEK